MNLHDVFIGLGSNIAPEDHILRALEKLAARVAITAISTFYRTPALERPSQPDFLNGVVRVRTELAPAALKFGALRPIEQELGRTRHADPFGPRTIDLDILLFDDAIIEGKGLHIPDPDIRNRPFLAICLLELAPQLVLPGDAAPLAAQCFPRDSAGLTPDPDFTRALRERFAV